MEREALKQYRAPVRLNVYDLIMPDRPDTLSTLNYYLYQGGLGVYHSGVEVYDMEYAFGGHMDDSTGVFEVEPRQAPEARFRQAVDIGDTDLDPNEVGRVVRAMAAKYPGNSYNLLDRNCNHFADELCLELTGRRAPGWVNRMAWLGTNLRCFLPEGFDTPVTSGSESGSSALPALPSGSPSGLSLPAPEGRGPPGPGARDRA